MRWNFEPQKKEINRSSFRHKESYKQSQKKINMLQESEAGAPPSQALTAESKLSQSSIKSSKYSVVLRGKDNFV